MTPVSLAILLFSIALVLLVLEFILPAHGVIGVLGFLALVGAVGVCLSINQYLGLGVVLGLAVVAPFAGAAWVKLWPKTPVGRRLILGPAARTSLPPAVKVGELGVVVTELRPTGWCEFPGGERLEARAEVGLVPAGRTVEVIGFVNGRPTVRAV